MGIWFLPRGTYIYIYIYCFFPPIAPTLLSTPRLMEGVETGRQRVFACCRMLRSVVTYIDEHCDSLSRVYYNYIIIISSSSIVC
jgi:hypothetical protein